MLSENISTTKKGELWFLRLDASKLVHISNILQHMIVINVLDLCRTLLLTSCHSSTEIRFKRNQKYFKIITV